MKKSIFEEFAEFFEKPTRATLRALLQSNFGETDLLDFKEAWPSDPNLARHALALANSGGGAVVLGVKQEDNGSLVSMGLEKLRDKAEVSQGLAKFFPPSFDYVVLDFAYKTSEYGELNGKSFQVLVVESDDKRIPYQARADGDGVSANVIYVRRGTESIPANHDELERLINKRIQSGYSSSSVLRLEEHLQQLKSLYGSISPVKTSSILGNWFAEAASSMFKSEPNPLYPKEKYEEFVASLISRKQRKIEQVLELTE